MPKFFDELDALEEPGPVPVGGGAVTAENPVCWNCREQIERPGWHVVPDTQEYSCIPRTQPPVNTRVQTTTHMGYPPAGWGWAFG